MIWSSPIRSDPGFVDAAVKSVIISSFSSRSTFTSIQQNGPGKGLEPGPPDPGVSTLITMWSPHLYNFSLEPWLNMLFLFYFAVDAACCRNDKNLDLILVTDCGTSNPALLGHLKTQLCYLVNAIFEKAFHLRLALICYQNHQKQSRGGMRSGKPPINSIPVIHTLNFTNNREEMKNSIKNLRCFGKGGTTKGLADGLASVLRLSEADDNPDSSKCRKDAIKICILLREYKEEEY